MSHPRTVIRIHRIVAALAIGFAAYQTFSLAALHQDFRDAQAIHQAAIYGVSYALRSEQAKAGQIQSNRIAIKEALQNNRGYVDNILAELEQCHATNTMLSEGWTGETIIDTEG